MRKSIALLVAVVGFSPAVFAAPAASAASCPTVITSIAMNEIELYAGSEPVVVGVQKVKTTTLNVYVADNDEDCTPPTSVTADLYHGTDFRARIRMGNLTYAHAADDNFIYAGDVLWDPATMDNANYPGRWSAQVTATGTTTDHATGTFFVQRRAVARVNVTPEPVAKGRTLTAAGALRRANWDTKHYAGYARRSMTLEFRPLPSGGYGPIKAATTDGDGRVAVAVPATVDGCYHYVFAGTSTTSATTSVGDCVDVR